MLHHALLYDELDGLKVQCNLCAHRCKINDGQLGFCRVRENRGGQLFTRNYGNLIANHVDPIEKKPLYHFLPGTHSLSVASPGCNFTCEWCQNWQISQLPRLAHLPKGKNFTPEQIVAQAKAEGCHSISYTYTEPTIFFEFCLDTAKLAKEIGIKNIFVTNGFMTQETVDMIAPYLDAANVDIKSFRDKTYRTLMSGRLEPVLETCKLLKSQGIWVEITTLIVPGINDDLIELAQLAEFISDQVGQGTPWHLSRFFPQYRSLEKQPTDEHILTDTARIGQEAGLRNIYFGNLQSDNNTHCHQCGNTLIVRRDYSIKMPGIGQEGRCHQCGALFDGVLMN